MDRQPGPALAVVGAQSADPGDDRRDAVGPVAGRDVGAEPDQRVAARIALAVPGPAPPDGDLELDHRLEPVDVGAFEESDLDQSHGPGRIASLRTVPGRARCRSSPRRLAARCRPPTRTTLELDAPARPIAADLPDYLDDLRRLVDIDCGSYTPEGVDEVGRWVAGFLSGLGADVDIRPDPEGRYGNTVIGTFDGTAGGPRVVLIGHMDTVFDPGTAAERPFRIEGGIAHGPGVTDMKSGLLAGLYALKAIIAEVGGLPFERVTFIANPDEEIGSPSSTPHIRALAADADACLVLECARANGDIVSSRKGILDTRLTVHGRAAHAGVEPEKGRSAILEAARLIRDLHALNGRWPGVTVNVGKVAGGTRPNVVAERCDLEVDVRSVTNEGLEAVEAAVRERRGRDRGAGHDRRRARHGRAGGRWRSWPAAAASSSTPRTSPRRLGFEVGDAATGGASDANTTAGMGVPSLDGLGPDRRQRPLAGRVPRGRLDRAADDAARRAAAGHRPRPGGPRLARRTTRASRGA